MLLLTHYSLTIGMNHFWFNNIYQRLTVHKKTILYFFSNVDVKTGYIIYFFPWFLKKIQVYISAWYNPIYYSHLVITNKILPDYVCDRSWHTSKCRISKTQLHYFLICVIKRNDGFIKFALTIWPPLDLCGARLKNAACLLNKFISIGPEVNIIQLISERWQCGDMESTFPGRRPNWAFRWRRRKVAGAGQWPSLLEFVTWVFYSNI